MVSPSASIQIAYGTPRKLPKAQSLRGRVVVLDIAFAAGVSGASFERTTKPFIDGLGERLAMWVDHHDHDLHREFIDDPRFVLYTKQQHGACPEIVTPELVERAGRIDSICCHTDFDGLCAAAKWLRGGVEPYVGADDDARAIDTRIGPASTRAIAMDRALRAKPNDEGLRGLIVRFLADGALDLGIYREIEKSAEALVVKEKNTRALAQGFRRIGDVVVVDVDGAPPYDKTLLLLLGQERARVAIVYDSHTVTAAANFNSGINFVELFGLEGGMPTRVSVARPDLNRVLEALGVPKDDLL